MSAAISMTEDDVFTALRSFLLLILPAGVEVVQTQDNGVPMPQGPFVSMNQVGAKRLATNVHTYAADQTMGVETDTQYTIQVDFFGPNSGDWALTFQTLFRDEFAAQNFPAGVAPLYADDPVQMPLINGESQWEQRWRSQAVMQINPVVTVSQPSATAIEVGLAEVDTHFPP